MPFGLSLFGGRRPQELATANLDGKRGKRARRAAGKRSRAARRKQRQ